MSIRHPFRKRAAVGCFAAAVSSAIAQNPAATVNVNAGANRHAISPLIYGANWADQASISDLNLSVNRRGGNATTTYNWQMNCTNRAGDWYFESLSDGPAIPSASADSFINTTKAGGAAPMITIPLVDWVAKVGPSRQGLTPYSVAKYGAQTSSDPWWSDAGNGVRASDGTRIVADPNDAYVTNSPAFQKQWVQYLTNTFGNSSGGGIKYYLMDNEHGVWPSNHRPIVPVGPTMDSIRDRIIAYGGVVKEVDPNAQIVGPEEWGWPNYFNSPYDTQNPGGTDRANHGGWDFMPWLLKEMKAHETSTGQRLLDVFSLHYYPQPGEFYDGDGTSTAAQLMRNQCTRDLWDPNYTSTSWINNKVKLIPRMKDWVNSNYPGTKIAVTEYSWGAESHISGGIAQADVLGIFGREGVDLATFWGNVSSNAQPTRNAFKMYRNYDGAKGTFGDTGVSSTVANPDNVSAFAAERSSDGALTVMVLNKFLTGNTPVTVNVANFPAGSAAQVWQFTSANVINRLADAAVTNGSISISAPAQSVTLFVIPGSGVVPNNLKAHYPFEGNAQDGSGSGNHGTATALTYVTGPLGGQAAQFNGTSSNVSIPRSVTDDFTVSMWVKTTDTAGAANAQWWAGKGLVDGEIGGGGADWGTSIVNGKFVLGVGATSGDTTFASSVNVNDGSWHHLAATRSNINGATAVYVDGVLSGSGIGPTGSRTFPASLRIGSLQTGNNFLNGTIDEVRLYDRVLSATEVAELARSPYGGTPWPVPGVIQAEDYDIGGPGFAYNDSDPANNGGQYRSDGVDLETCAEGGYNVGWVGAGEWLEYTVNVAYTGSYGITLRAASASLPIQWHVEFDGVDATGLMTAPATGGWQNYTNVTAPNLPLTAGQHVMRLYFDGAAWNLNHITLTANPLPAPQNVTAIGGSSQIALSWNAVDGATDYVVKRSGSGGGPFVDLATGVAGASYANTGLADGTTWYYTVAANGPPGVGTASSAASATTYTAVENWRLANFGSIANTGNAADSADPDGDGWSNEQEYISGTGPNNRAELLKFDSMQANGNNMRLTFPSVLGRTYRIERSGTLSGGSWQTVQENIPGTGSPIQIIDTGGAGQVQRFYRIVVGW